MMARLANALLLVALTAPAAVIAQTCTQSTPGYSILCDTRDGAGFWRDPVQRQCTNVLAPCTDYSTYDLILLTGTGCSRTCPTSHPTQVSKCERTDNPSITCGKAPTTTGTADPHMVDFRGNAWEFAGISGAVFSVVSSLEQQINMALTSFNQPDSTFIYALGTMLGKDMRASIATAESCIQANSSIPLAVTLNDDIMHPGQVKSATGSRGTIMVAYHAPGDDGVHKVEIRTPFAQLSAVREADACHLDMSLSILAARDPHAVEGLLGQTLRCTLNTTAPCAFTGDEAHFLVSDLFSYDAPTNHYDPEATLAAGRSLVAGMQRMHAMYDFAKGTKGLKMALRS